MLVAGCLSARLTLIVKVPFPITFETRHAPAGVLDLQSCGCYVTLLV